MHLDPEREAELGELITRLDRLVPRAGAHLTIPAGSQAGVAVGNRVGYLRFGIAILSAALRPLPGAGSTPARIVPELDGLLTEDSSGAFDVCEIDEAIVSRPPAQSKLGALGQIVAGVLLVALALALFLLLAFVWRWLLG